jgi:hypothetical protein
MSRIVIALCSTAAVLGGLVSQADAATQNILLTATGKGVERQYCSAGPVTVKDPAGNVVVDFSTICVDVVDVGSGIDHKVEARLGTTQYHSVGHYDISANDMKTHVYLNMIGQDQSGLFDINMGYIQRVCPDNQLITLTGSTPVATNVPIMPNAGNTATLVLNWPSGDAHDVTCRPDQR